TKVMPPYTDAERRLALAPALRHFASLGLTGVGAADQRSFRLAADGCGRRGQAEFDHPGR
ncbi:MAG: hypothetical protein J0I66_00430, partial [Microbacterium sp.]|nr:hypothetical protein [Microbacterium sp.]